MKKFKSKIIVGVLTLAVVSGIGMMYTSSRLDSTQQGNWEGEQSEEYQAKKDYSQDLLTKLEVAEQSYQEDGMRNLYPSMKRKEQREWLKRVNENSYFATEGNIEYQLTGVYEIGTNQYFLLGWGGAHNALAEDIFQLVLEQEEEHYFVTDVIYPSVEILSSEEVAAYKKEELEESNVSIEYSEIDEFEDLGQYIDYLDETIGELDEAVNSNAQSEVTRYVQYAIEQLSSRVITPQDNTINVAEELLTQMGHSVSVAKDEFGELLEENDITFNKSLNSVLRLEVEQIDFTKPIYIQLPDNFEEFGEATGIRILLDDQSYVYVDAADFDTLAGVKIKIERLEDQRTYAITFLDTSDEVMEQIDANVTFAFPAADDLSTVIIRYDEERLNWGGQYDPVSGTIAFGTKYTAEYEVVDDYITIKDIDDLPNSQQSAIKFMVSKGYLNLEEDYFYPYATFTRYEFAEALVKMFFALDPALDTTFEDVPLDSPYYPYIASGETYDIIKGYSDGTFRGDVTITVEQAISLAARTIADQKGYIYPEYTEDYIRFVDADEIAAWAIDDIALAVQNGLVTSGGRLSPKAEITKAQSAEVLYNLFMLLYETSPGEIVDLTPESKTYSILIVFLLLVLALWIIWRFIKRNKIIITMIVCTIAIILTMIIGFKGGF